MQTSAKITVCGFVILTFLSGCGHGRQTAGPYPRVDLQGKVVKPGVLDRASTERPYKIAVAGMSSPGKAVETYQPIIVYLSRRLHHPAQLVLANSYAELNEMLGSGDVDAAFICSGGYVDGHSNFGLELIAAPEYKGQATYFCYIIVPTESVAGGLSDLRSKQFAYTDRDSNTGCFIPTYHIMKMGERPESFFDRIMYTSSHDKAIMAVERGMVDGAAVDSLVYEQAVQNNPNIKKKTRVICRYGPCASPPIVASPNTPEPFRRSLKQILLNMHKDKQGKRLLGHIMADRFVAVDDSAYNSIRAMRKEMALWASRSRLRAK